jgi:hypothetical protein
VSKKDMFLAVVLGMCLRIDDETNGPQSAKIATKYETVIVKLGSHNLVPMMLLLEPNVPYLEGAGRPAIRVASPVENDGSRATSPPVAVNGPSHA